MNKKDGINVDKNIKIRAEKAAEEILSIPRFTEERDAALLRDYLEALDHPESGLYVVHVAGTNGKGSVTRMLRGLLTLSGKKTGGFYSPHLIRINERMEVDGEEITDEEFVSVYDEFKAVVDRKKPGRLNCFETLFILALLFFRRRKATHVVLETGLGGRLDATTSIPAELYVITQIGLDHEEYLGNTIEKIAAEKAGIITGNSPLVMNTGSRSADEVIERKALEMGVSAIVNAGNHIVSDVAFSASGIDFSLQNDYDMYQRFHLPCYAGYQIRNAVTALCASEFLLADRSPEERERLQKEMLLGFSWMGRLTEAAPGIWLDGAHNPSAADELQSSLPYLLKDYNRLIFAASADKNVEGVLQRLAVLPWNELWLVPYSGSRSMKREELQALACRIFLPETVIMQFGSPKEAVSALMRADEENKAEDSTFTLAAGSLYLVGELLEYIRASGLSDAEKGEKVE